MSGLIRLRGGERLHVEELLPVGFAKCMQVVDQLQLEGELLSSAVETSDGFEVIAIEHLEFEPTCTAKFPHGVCGRPALWNVLCASCDGHMGLACDPCRQSILVSEHVYGHRPCGFEAVYPDLVRFLSLGGS